jgi:hypothetical protein
MTWQWLALGALALVALLLVAALVWLRGRTRAELAAAREESAALRQRLDRLEADRTRPEPPARTAEREYTITHVGEQPPADVEPATLERAVFADLLLRESVIRLGALSHGVRRALSAESRHRIRFEMKREVKRARKQRRVEQREAYREWQARRRADVPDDELRETA